MPRKTTKITKQPALYLRVSTDEQSDTGYGLSVQEDQTRRLAASYDDREPIIYTDANVSGTKPITERPAFSQLMADIDAGKIDTVIVSALDRLARRASLLLNTWDLLESKGIVIQTYKERIDTGTAVGRMMRTMLAAIAEFERDTIVERTTDGRNKRGKKDGDKGGALPYGYVRNAGIVGIDADKAKIVKQVFKLRKQGLTLRDIAAEIKTLSFRGVKIVLDNEPAYRGGLRNENEQGVKWPKILAS